MIRDMDFVRQLLNDIANGKEEYGLIEIQKNINQQDQYEEDKKIKYHLKILREVGLVSWGKHSIYGDGMGYFEEVRLTWDGQEYYSNIKNDTIWTNIKEYLKSNGQTFGDVGFNMLIDIAKLKAKEFMGN